MPTIVAYTAQSPRPTCSIAFAVHRVAHAAGIELDADDLCSALALPWLFCAAKDDIPAGDGPFLARDMFLIPTAHALGMAVREIHPPAAAHDLHRRHEFRQHFQASYAPIVARALENGQSVLAWRGWPGDAERCWGLVTDICDEGVGLSGSVLLSALEEEHATRSVLENPPVQVYVIEHVDPTPPTPDELAKLMLGNCRALFNDQCGADYGVSTGPNGFRSLLADLDGATGNRGVGSVNSSDGADHLAMFVHDLEIGLGSMRRYLANARGSGADSMGELLRHSEKLHSALANISCPVDDSNAQPMDQSDSAVRDAVTQAVALSEAMRDSLQSPPLSSAMQKPNLP